LYLIVQPAWWKVEGRLLGAAVGGDIFVVGFDAWLMVCMRRDEEIGLIILAGS
jgi:hypothetical protein